MSAVFSERIEKERAAASSVLSTGVAGAERQQDAFATLAARGLPTTRDENWKYANLRTLEKVRLAPASPRTRTDIDASALPALIEGYARYTFVDGSFVPELSRPSSVAGVSVRSLRDVRGVVAAADASTSEFTQRDAARGGTISVVDDGAARGRTISAVDDGAGRGGNVTAGARDAASAARGALAQGTAPTTAATPDGDNRFALLNDAFATDGATINVAKGVDCPGCIEVLFIATEAGQTAASYPRLELTVQANARLGLIERHISLTDDSNFVNTLVRVDIARDARVAHYRIQQAGARASWFDTLDAKLEENARYELHAVNLGALSARSTLHIQLAGEHAELAMHVVSLADHQQVHDAFALVDHIAPNTKSEQNVRGIAGGRSRVAFNSKVVVREHAQHTDSRQSLRGLLAGAQAEIDVRPQLEIYTDDVRCNHGATAGKLDDNMLFYLLSRGIDRDTAQQLLKWAFLEDVVSRITIPELRKDIEASLAGQMHEAAALKELI